MSHRSHKHALQGHFVLFAHNPKQTGINIADKLFFSVSHNHLFRGNRTYLSRTASQLVPNSSTMSCVHFSFRIHCMPLCFSCAVRVQPSVERLQQGSWGSEFSMQALSSDDVWCISPHQPGKAAKVGLFVFARVFGH